MIFPTGWAFYTWKMGEVMLLDIVVDINFPVEIFSSSGLYICFLHLAMIYIGGLKGIEFEDPFADDICFVSCKCTFILLIVYVVIGRQAHMSISTKATGDFSSESSTSLSIVESVKNFVSFYHF